MKKRYTKKQILESIKYWKKQLQEDISYSGTIYDLVSEIKEQLQALNVNIDDLNNHLAKDPSNFERTREIVENLNEGYREIAAFFGM